MKDMTGIKSNLHDRVEATKDLVNFSITKELVADVKGRFGKNVTEPSMGKKYNLPGTAGGLLGTVVAVPVAILDKVEKFAQEQAAITRRWIK